MFRRFWQVAMISLARSKGMKHFMQNNRATSSISTRYVAGKNADEAVNFARNMRLNNQIRSSLFYLGEYVDTIELVKENVGRKFDAVNSLKQTDLDVHISVDPTQIGYSIEHSIARENALQISQEIQKSSEGREGVHCIMLDMEDASVIDDTINLHNDLQQKGLPVALTLQAYLKRTASDMESLINSGAKVRLVKGAFVAGHDIAYTQQTEIKKNYRRLVKIMFSEKAREQGFYPIIATHDEQLHDFAISIAKQNGWVQGQYEFEMLLGVRTDVAEQLSNRGERVRLYIPFGLDWWPYAVRRIGENPINGFLLARSLIN